MGTKALMEQWCVNQHGMGIYTVVILSKDEDENSRLIKHKMIPIKERVANKHLFIRRKRVLITVMRNAWIPQLPERRASPLNS